MHGGWQTSGTVKVCHLAFNLCGSVLGIVCNKILFSKLITYKWGDAWSVPLVQLGIIIVVVAIAVILAVRNPIKKLEKTSIVDIISVQ